MNDVVELEGIDARGIVFSKSCSNVLQEVSESGLMVGRYKRLI